MPEGTILFVHGTGVRLKTYRKTFDLVRQRAAQEGIAQTVVECEWGDALGVEFAGKSLPDDPDPEQQRQDEDRQLEWSYLQEDPFFELRMLTVEPRPSATVFGQQPAHEKLWALVKAYQPSLELEALLARRGVLELWPAVWQTIVESTPIAKQAVYASGNQTADVANALARSLFAELDVHAQAHGLPALGSRFRDQLVLRLSADWGQQVYALRAVVKAFFTRALRGKRRAWSERFSPELGDILLYQSRGEAIRAFIRKKIAAVEPPVYLLAHSLGGIACTDLLAMPGPPAVAGLITAGSQAPLLYELGALASLGPGEPLPAGFPPWVNLYDRNDFLSYVARRLFPAAEDVEVESGELPLAAHSAYWGCDETWAAIKRVVAA